jgi:hypothetical protein
MRCCKLAGIEGCKMQDDKVQCSNEAAGGWMSKKVND